MRITTLLLVCLMPISASAQAPERQRKLPITVSKETTRITKPLREDGSVDYIGALNQQASRGVTPENNANVLLWKAFGPKEIDEEIRPTYFRALGIEPLPDQGDYFVSMYEFSEREKFDEAQLYDHYDAAMIRPWSKKQYPDVARWMRANRKPLELAIEATRRPRFYSPLIASGEEPIMVGVVQPGFVGQRRIARALVARAMLRTQEGQVEAARADLMACHRLARHVARAPTLVHSLVGLAMEGIALRADASMAHFGNLSADQARALAADLATLPPLSPVVGKIDRCERYVFLDSVALLVRVGPSALSGLPSSAPDQDLMNRMIETMAADVLIDWDIVLRIGNSYYDRLVDAMNRPTHAECAAAMNEITQEIELLGKGVRDAKQIGEEVLKAGSPRRASSKYIANILVALLLPHVGMVKDAEDRATVKMQLTRAAVFLSAHRAEQGEYPKKLAELEADDDLLEDPYIAKPLCYRRQRDGYLLYSVGPNAIDDRGRNYRLDGRPRGDSDHDDLALRMPPRKP